jgi:hypothetical protein
MKCSPGKSSFTDFRSRSISRETTVFAYRNKIWLNFARGGRDLHPSVRECEALGAIAGKANVRINL